MDAKLKFKAAAELLGIPINTLYSLVYRRAIPHHRYGRRLVRFSRDALERWMKDREVIATSASSTARKKS